MIFNSLDFGIFLPIVFFLYWFVFNKSLKKQNILILVASYVFYGWWDWRFLSLIAFSTLVDFTIGNQLLKQKEETKRKLLLWTSICVNLGFLGFFKYYNFFLENFLDAFTFFGGTISASSLNIILPVGISFYTFQTLSYTIDVYKGKIKPTNNFIDFAAFVSFFPQLVAGPIERATNLLPQFYTKRTFSYANSVIGMRQILWGLVKKVVIADSCSYYANEIFNNHQDYNGSTLLLGGVFFAFQIYGDFSGYSDIAIGTSRLFGFKLLQNFSFPYFSRDMAEFWRRWHISLNTWFRDYLYIPLGGSRGSIFLKLRNVFIIFIVSGFWHGANWTFIIWGALNALYFVPLMIFGINRNNTGVIAYTTFKDALIVTIKISGTFLLTVLAWIFFRSASITQAFEIISEIFSLSLFSIPTVFPKTTILLIVLFMVIEWFGRNQEFAIEKFSFFKYRLVRYGCYITLSVLIYVSHSSGKEFIYFQF